MSIAAADVSSAAAAVVAQLVIVFAPNYESTGALFVADYFFCLRLDLLGLLAQQQQQHR